MRENELENKKTNVKSGQDFLYEIYFSGVKFFRREIFLPSSSTGSSTSGRRVGQRGPDRQPRKRGSWPWELGEAKHARILQLLREGRSKVLIAKELGVGVRTVQRRADALRREDDEPGTVDFRRVRGEVCAKHGPVVIWPCVQCLAELEREKQIEREKQQRESN